MESTSYTRQTFVADLSEDATRRFPLEPECPEQPRGADVINQHGYYVATILRRVKYLSCLKKKMWKPLLNIASEARLKCPHLVYSSRVVTRISNHLPRHWTFDPYVNFM